MERRRERPKEAEKKEKVEDEELKEHLRELKRLKQLKKQKLIQEEKQRLKKEIDSQKANTAQEIQSNGKNTNNSINAFASELDKKIDEIEINFQQNLDKSQLKQLLQQQELLKSTLLKEKIISPYEKLLEQHTWLEERRYEFMYFIPDNEKDMGSWKTEWSQVLFDYAKYAVLHILYIKEISSKKPFSKFKKRIKAVKTIAEELIDQNLAKWIGKKKQLKLRVYWRDLEAWADDIYTWCIEQGKLEPVMIYEIRESNKQFSNLPKEDLREVYEILAEQNRGRIIELDNNKLAFKINP